MYLFYRNDMSEVQKLTTKLKNHFNEFIANVKTENEETRAAFDLLLRASRKELVDKEGNYRKLTEKEKEEIRQQAGDVLKMLGLTSLTLLPGGTLVLILINVFRLNDHLLPSSFKKVKKH
jgi:hypothetical protein